MYPLCIKESLIAPYDKERLYLKEAYEFYVEFCNQMMYKEEFFEKIRDGHVIFGHEFLFYAENLPEQNIVNIHTDIPLIVALDFDGVITKGDGLVLNGKKKRLEIYDGFDEFYRKVRRLPVKLILWTCREGELLREALQFLYWLGYKFDEVNEDIEEVRALFCPGSRKIFAHLYVDDLNESGFSGFPSLYSKILKLLEERDELGIKQKGSK